MSRGEEKRTKWDRKGSKRRKHLRASVPSKEAKRYYADTDSVHDAKAKIELKGLTLLGAIDHSYRKGFNSGFAFGYDKGWHVGFNRAKEIWTEAFDKNSRRAKRKLARK